MQTSRRSRIYDTAVRSLTAALGSLALNSRLRAKVLREFREGLICDALWVTGGNRARAAKLLGLHRTSLHRLLTQLAR